MPRILFFRIFHQRKKTIKINIYSMEILVLTTLNSVTSKRRHYLAIVVR